MKPIFLALVHHPVLDRGGEVITTAVTNLDVHDIARSARTYGLAGYFLVSPIEAQRALIERILEHWLHGSGKTRIPERAEALALCEPVISLEEAVARVTERTGEAPLEVATSARPARPTTGYGTLRAALEQSPGLLVFGTGHGLAPSVMERAHHVLPAIRGDAPYNHLSVRAAVAIALDRLIDRPIDA